ncbi:AraC family transcriptional regulator [Amaricoccus sp.]|uniref:AraC family transcriptional regulator n=1 Tax=Amaricoccus sp. TaxID=1872485 RepID=UPI001B5466A4|nr:AraC family transcriptional regulator [Amaricoccus sp.]MBP7001440.1 AraC family transcriptional regulator [Amaricoccus sp.]
MIESPGGPGSDVLSGVLRMVRLSAALQFCFAPRGDWRTAGRRGLADLVSRADEAIPFHVVVEGTCWLDVAGRRETLAAGDVVAFPTRAPHDLGAGAGRRPIDPVSDLPERPWREAPLLDYAGEGVRARILCGVLVCDVTSFPPLRAALPEMMLARAGEAGPWLAAAVAQMAAEVDTPRAGGISMLERLSEVVFIELLRREIGGARAGGVGWLAALADPRLARCIAAIHADPARDWSVEALAGLAGLSRSALCARFAAVLGATPMRYVRSWRLFLARDALQSGARPIAEVAWEAGYGAEAAFNRAFSRAFGMPPAAWRDAARAGA